MKGVEGGEGGAGRRVLGQSPYGPALEQALVLVQVQDPLTSRLLPGAVLKKALSASNRARAAASLRVHMTSRLLQGAVLM